MNTSVFVIVAAAVFLTATFIDAQPVRAQSLLEAIFGFTKPKPAPRRYRRPRRPTPPSGFDLFFSKPPVRQSRPKRRYVSRFRTICVRACDGYYFPISYSTSKRNLKRDAADCNARCPGQGKLFRMSNPAGDIGDAVDYRGNKYADLAHAFRYRKEYVANCACRPAPWSTQAQLRHAGYARGTAEPGSGSIVVAGRYETAHKTPAVPMRRPESPQAETSDEPAEITAEAGADVGAFELPGSNDAANPVEIGVRPQRQRKTPQRRKRSNVAAKPANRRKAQPTPASFSLFGTGASNMRWPGD